MKTTRITITAYGYRWRVHGQNERGLWRCHLVELLGPEELGIPIDHKLRSELRVEVARCLGLKVSKIKPLPADIILTDLSRTWP